MFHDHLADTSRPHRRLNPLTGEWVLVSPQRMYRPWQGAIEPQRTVDVPSYDPECYLCPGNVRANGERNPRYESTHVFTNDFPALLPHRSSEVPEPDPLFRAENESGLCRVLCYSPRHDLSLGHMDRDAILRVVEMWIGQYREIGADERISWVQIFENRGAAMGASNPHPHGQLWAQQTLPNEAQREHVAQKSYLDAHGSCLLCDYGLREIESTERVVFLNKSFVALVPFWAVWPFEMLLVSRRHLASLDDLQESGREDLAEAIAVIARCYDGLFGVSFPYSMGFHQRPTDGENHPEWHLHAHYYPPMLSASVRKYLVGYELLAQPQRDSTPEAAARTLRNVAEASYTI